MIGSPHSPAHHPVGSPHWTLELNSAQQQFQRFTMVSCSSVEVPIETLLNELSIEIPVSSFSFRPPRCLKKSILHFVQNYFKSFILLLLFLLRLVLLQIFFFQKFFIWCLEFSPKWHFAEMRISLMCVMASFHLSQIFTWAFTSKPLCQGWMLQTKLSKVVKPG